MNELTWKRVTIFIGIVFFVPIVLSVAFKLIDLGSIGPIVLFYSLLSLPAFIFIYIKSPIKIAQLQFSAIVGALFSGTLFILLFNYFMLLTHLLGIHDYQAM
jgi:hypothetical protein